MYTINKVYSNCVFPGSSFLGGGGGEVGGGYKNKPKKSIKTHFNG